MERLQAAIVALDCSFQRSALRANLCRLAVRRTVKGVDFQREAGKESVELSAMRQVGPIHFFLLMCLLGRSLVD